MPNIHLDRVPRIVQGVDSLAEIGGLIAGLAPKGAAVLLVIDPGLNATATPGIAEESLKSAGYQVHRFDKLKSDPTMASVDEAAGIARAAKAAAVVSIGGGSGMDVGKCVAAIAGADLPTAHYGLCANPFPKNRLANICVPTTSGTGSETTRTGVFADAEGAKIWLWGDEMKPDLVVLDPRVTVGLPPHLTAATGIDALVHALEAATNVNANAANNVFCHEAIRLVVRHLPKAVANPGDLEARGGLQWAACLAGIGIDNCGTAIAHNIGHALASLRPIHHGRAVGLALNATLAWNIVGDDGRFAEVALAMGGPRDAAYVPKAFDKLLREVGVKISLRGEGHDAITAQQLAAQMARPENAPMRRSNRRTVEDADLLTFATTLLSEP